MQALLSEEKVGDTNGTATIVLGLSQQLYTE